MPGRARELGIDEHEPKELFFHLRINAGAMDNTPLDSQPQVPSRAEAGQKLWERLNRREIKVSTLQRAATSGKRICSVLSPASMTGSVTTAELQNLIDYAHSVLWERLLGGSWRKSTVRLHCYPEELLLKPRPALLQSRYGVPTDIIHIVFPREKLEDPCCVWPSPASGQPPGWETELLHELVHEHQFKLVTNPTAEGREMYDKELNRFSGRNHDERFYTAICSCARRLGVSPQEMRESM